MRSPSGPLVTPSGAGTTTAAREAPGSVCTTSRPGTPSTGSVPRITTLAKPGAGTDGKARW